MDLLLDLSQSLRDALIGPIGAFYWSERVDDLVAYIDIVIETYIIPVKQKIEVFIDLRLQKEFSMHLIEKNTDLVYQIKNNFKDILHNSLQQFFYYNGTNS